jgi:D-alanyl-D-alanine carboxypeptidase
MKKKLISAILILSAVMSLRVSAADVNAHAAIVYEPVTGTVLYEKNADERMLVASTTKIMTALVVLENCSLDESVEVTQAHTAVEGSSMYLRAGENYTVEDLLYGLLLASGNDAAEALAEHTAGSIEDFARLMNDKCAQLGVENTHFVNPHGLDEEGHYSSARDLAVITAAALENDTFREIFSTVHHSVNGVTYTNHNKLLTSCEGCTGGKTGYTEAAGRILVSCAKRDGMELICVTISDPDDWNDHNSLYDWAFSKYRLLPVLPENERISVISGTTEYVSLKADKPALLVSADSSVSVKTYLPGFVFAPVTAGDKAGEVCVTIDGEEQVIPVRYAQTVFIDGSIPLTPWERFKRAWYMAAGYGVYYPQT